MSGVLLELEDVTAKVQLGRRQLLTTVDSVSLEIIRGTSHAIVGKSGSGKTSLISILGLLNSDFTGRYSYAGSDVGRLSDRQRSKLRGSHIGFVFQNYSLIRHLNVAENVDLSLRYSNEKLSRRQRFARITQALEDVGLADRRKEYPGRLSGGEQQRVAIARALVLRPELLICDEPTGALDTDTGKHVLSVLMELVRSSRTTLVLVTHDSEVAAHCENVMHMDSGRLTHA
ncbi:ABC transporter ATP-binding protein [Schaalia sp. ZJ405]|uniref:ABC transporter ATP-binding protein n=1 Tax=unclassified Schaalia TaxID=2691889 RepID=UPI0013EDD88C|nr:MULTISPECIES: ABC transporter ATP-binding protein [unclassified Schaalia]QPK81810.1 ABC transporter ATP-binding protein [Schaalia sp. ZJ405]